MSEEKKGGFAANPHTKLENQATNTCPAYTAFCSRRNETDHRSLTHSYKHLTNSPHHSTPAYYLYIVSKTASRPPCSMPAQDSNRNNLSVHQVSIYHPPTQYQRVSFFQLKYSHSYPYSTSAQAYPLARQAPTQTSSVMLVVLVKLYPFKFLPLPYTLSV